MTQNIWLGSSLANQKVVTLTAGLNITSISPPPSWTLGLGPYVFSFTGWDPNEVADTWNNSTNTMIQEIVAMVSGSAVVFTMNNFGEDFELTCNLTGSVLNVYSTYQKMTFGPVPTGGNLVLTVDGQTTGNIAFSATQATFASNMQTAIAALAGFGSTDVVVTSLGGNAYTFDFSQGRFAGTNVPLITAVFTGLTGGNAGVTIVHNQTGNAGTSQVDQLSFPISGTHVTTVDEIQTISTTSTAGAFSITISGYGTTITMPYTAGRSVIQAALEQIVGVGNVIVTGGPLFWPQNSTNYDVTVEFTGALAGVNVPTMVVTATGGVDEIQYINMTGSPISGSFTLTFNSHTTATIDNSASAAVVQAALQALSNIGAGDVIVTGGPLIVVTGPIGRQNEIQTITGSGNSSSTAPLTAAGDTFTISFGGHTTAPIPVTASVSIIQTALQGLSSIGFGNVAVTGSPLVTQTGPFGAQSEIQTITPSGNATSTTSSSSDTFTLSFNGQTTAPIAVQASASTIQTALQGLSSIGSGNIAVTGGPFVTQTGPFGAQNEIQGMNFNVFNTTAANFNTSISWNGNSFNLNAIGDSPLDTYAKLCTAIQAGFDTIAGSGNTLCQFAPLAAGRGTFQFGGGVQGCLVPFTITFQGTLANQAQPLASYTFNKAGGGTTTTNAFDNGSTVDAACPRTQVGTSGNYDFAYSAITCTFEGTMTNSAESLISYTQGSVDATDMTATVSETQHGFAGGYLYAYGIVTVQFENALGSAPQALLTVNSTGAIVTALHGTVAETQLGSPGTYTFQHNRMQVEFVSSLGQAPQNLITSTTVTGSGAVVITEHQHGQTPSYTVTVNQDGGTTTVNNIAGGTFSLNINGTIVSNIPYNVTASALATKINTVFGSTVCSCSGGPAPGTPITITFSGALQKEPVTVVYINALQTNQQGSVTKTTIQSGVADPVGQNVWDLAISPGRDTMGIIGGTSPYSQVWITITNNLTALTAGVQETPVGQIYLGLADLNADLIQAAINEALSCDACRVVQIGRSQEWANVEIPAYGSGYNAVPVQWTNFWYYTDKYRITFLNQFATSGSIGMTATFPDLSKINPALQGYADPSLFMEAPSLGVDNGDGLDFFAEIQRVVIGFNAMINTSTPLHHCILQKSGSQTTSEVGWRFKLQTQYLDSSQHDKHTGVVAFPQQGTIQFHWNTKLVSVQGNAGSYSVQYTSIAQTPIIDWNSPASVIQTVLEEMFFGAGNIKVTGGLAWSWLSETLTDAPIGVAAYQDLKVTLTGQLHGLPIDEYGYELTCTLVSGQFPTPSPMQKNFQLVGDPISHTLPPHTNTRERISVANTDTANLSMQLSVGNQTIVLPQNSTAAQIQSLIDSLFPLTTALNGMFPTKLAQPIFVYGTTFADGPMEFEFTSLGMQGAGNGTDLVISASPVGVVIGQITVETQGVLAQNDIQTVTVTGRPYSGTWTLSQDTDTTGTLAYNEGLSGFQAALASAGISPTSVTGTAAGGFVLTWASSGGPQDTLTATSSLNNANGALAVTNIGGAGAGGGAFGITETTKGRGPNYYDDFNNWSLGHVPASGETITCDDSASAIMYGIDQTSIFLVTGIGASPTVATFQHTRNRQVFDNAQTVEFKLRAGTAPQGPATVHTFNTGTGQSFTVPAGITSLTIEVWGGGGGGGGPYNFGGGGGGAGGYCKSTVSVTPGDVFSITVGAGGTNTQGDDFEPPAAGPGGNSTVTCSKYSLTMIGYGGYAGGFGQTGHDTAGGGGLSEGGTTTSLTGSQGQDSEGLGSSGGHGGSGAVDGTETVVVQGGAGGLGGVGAGTAGNGVAPGGGGGGAGAGALAISGTGGGGQVVISYTTDALVDGNMYSIIDADNTGKFSLAYQGTPVSCTTIGNGTFQLVVANLTVNVNNQFTGTQIGLPHLRSTLFEYLSCYFKAFFEQITIGIGAGTGLSLGRFNTLDQATAVQINNTGQTTNFPVPAILLLADNSDTNVMVQSGDVGIAYYAEETAVVGNVTIVTGTLTVNNAEVAKIDKGAGATFKSYNTTLDHTIEMD